MRGVEETALALDRALTRSRVAYALAGDVAVMAWGEPRASAKLEILVQITYADLDPFLESLRGEGFEFPVDDVGASLIDRGTVAAQDKDSTIPIVFRLAKSVDERSEVASAIEVPLAGSRLRIAPPEETIAFRLRAGTPVDLEEARSVLARQAGHLDENRLREAAGRLGVAAALDKAMGDAQRR